MRHGSVQWIVEESGNTITLYDADNSVLGTVDVSSRMGNGEAATIDISISDISRMDVSLAKRGAISDVNFF